MRVSVFRTVVAGLCATVVLTALLVWIAPAVLGHPAEDVVAVSRLLGLGTGLGPLVHFLLGILIFPLVFSLLVGRVVPGPYAVRGLVWGFVLWLLAELIVLPAAGAGRFHAATGGSSAVLWSLAGHLAYGLVLGVFLKPRAEVRDMVEMREEMGSVTWTDL